jgi:hypothetical protein
MLSSPGKLWAGQGADFFQACACQRLQSDDDPVIGRQRSVSKDSLEQGA